MIFLLYHKHGKIKCMVTAIVISIGMFLLLAIVGAVYFVYSLITKNYSTMNSDQKTKALDVFVYLGIGISLVVSVTNILQIVFRAIEQRFVDVIDMNNYVDIYSSDVRMAIASLVVMYPLYLGLSWYVAKDISKFLYKRDIAIRKVMIYTTLFITLCTLVGTLVSIIYTYLGGELSVRFGLKALAVFVVAGSLFAYYLYSVRRDYSKKTSVPMIASIVATLAVIASLVWSVMIIGTPAEMRAKRIDSQRLSNLSSLQQQIFDRFQTTEKLPLTLDELNNAFQGYVVPVDPVTGKVYVYKVVQQPVVKMNYTSNKKELTTQGIFEICGTFDIERVASPQGQGKGGISFPTPASDSFYSATNYYYDNDQSPYWNHPKGDTCFKRIISAEMYYGR